MASQNNDQVAPAETAEILRLAAQALTADGDFVELGCYRGDTSVLLGKLLQQNHNSSLMSKAADYPIPSAPVQPAENSVNSSANLVANPTAKHLWIYDSFAGLPAKTREDQSGAGVNFQGGELLVTKREVIAKLKKHGLKVVSRPDPSSTAVIVKKAWFSDLADQDLPPAIAFAFCDGDFYGSIKTSLQLVQPRLTKQGMIIVHDYNNPQLPGSARAVDEFLRVHPEFKLQIHHTLAILTR